MIEERVSGTTRLSYVWSPVYVDAMIARDRDSDSNGSLEERLYAVHDANFNVVALLDTSGAVVERFAYDAFGVFSVLTPGWGVRGSSSYAWIYLHQGLKWDTDLDGYDNRRRILGPAIGRFFQPDPSGFSAGDVCLYRYVGNRPTVATDPTGLAVQFVYNYAVKQVAKDAQKKAGRLGLLKAMIFQFGGGDSDWKIPARSTFGFFRMPGATSEGTLGLNLDRPRRDIKKQAELGGIAGVTVDTHLLVTWYVADAYDFTKKPPALNPAPCGRVKFELTFMFEIKGTDGDSNPYRQVIRAVTTFSHEMSVEDVVNAPLVPGPRTAPSFLKPQAFPPATAKE